MTGRREADREASGSQAPGQSGEVSASPPGITARPRGAAADRRRLIADERDFAADLRDAAADERDNAADKRDVLADQRDAAAHVRDLTANPSHAAADRAQAAADRAQAAADRIHATADREQAAIDRAEAARSRETLSMDTLTGTHRRGPGLLELDREIIRAKRTGQSYIVAFIDVDYLKATNDAQGHAAGDRLLQLVSNTVRAHLRPYDLIVRVGGDEFVCGLPDMHPADMADRWRAIESDLKTHSASITTGVAALDAHDGLDSLMTRADAHMYEQRRQRRDPDVIPP